MTLTELIEESQNGIDKQPLRIKIQIYLIAAISNAANFIARTFTGLYAVFIESSSTALSFITSLRNLVEQAFQSTLGRISDRIGRKIMMFIGLLISGVTIALFPFIKNQWVLVFGVVILSVGFASFFPSFNALQGDLTTKKNRAGLIGFITIIGAIATTIALLIVGFVGDTGDSVQTEFIIILEITAGLFIIAGIISIILIEPQTKRLKKRSAFTLKPIKENPTFRRFVIVNCVMNFFMALGWPIFPVVRSEFATNLENTWIWVIFSICQILILFLSKPIINKIGRKWLLFIGRVGLFFVPVNLALAIIWLPTWWFMSLSSIISGFCNAFYFVGQNSYILDCAPEAEKGTYTGIHNLFVGVVTFVASLVMGIIADYVRILDNEWLTIYVLLWIIAGGRLIASMGYLFITEPKTTIRVEELPVMFTSTK
ncbi:MAG: MFS transporter [Candidatus Heimdallarchaeota archaeon]|nr:MFS transporter [Candidatus Heimdallarchaeota archaeon]